MCEEMRKYSLGRGESDEKSELIFMMFESSFMWLVKAAVFFMTPMCNLARKATVFLSVQTWLLLQY